MTGRRSDLVVDVGGALGRDFLHDVDWGAIVPADALVVTAEGALGTT